MKMVTAIIKPYRLEQVQTALGELGVGGFHATEVKHFREQYKVTFLPKLKIEIAVHDKLADRVVQAIWGATDNGRSDDCEMYLSHIGECWDIMTGTNEVEKPVTVA